MKRLAFLSVAGLLALTPLAASTAQAAGCVRGAIVGGVAGHFMGHHGMVGAAAGCAIGHHEANVRERDRYYNDHSFSRY